MFTSITVNVWLFSSRLVHWSGRLETSHKLTPSIADFLYEFWHRNFSKIASFQRFPCDYSSCKHTTTGPCKRIPCCRHCVHDFWTEHQSFFIILLNLMYMTLQLIPFERKQIHYVLYIVLLNTFSIQFWYLLV